MSPAPIHLVVALPAEAKPVVSWLNLKRTQPAQGFPIYGHRHIRLVVAGSGKTNAAAATAFLYAMGGCPRDAVWVNLGIAGHAGREVGTVVLADQISDAGTNWSWYPLLTMNAPCPTDALVTLDRPDLSYRRQAMLDMEASGFYATARRFSTPELVQVLKVISDNRHETADGLDAVRVRRLVSGSLDTLSRLLRGLGEFARDIQENRTPKKIQRE